MTTRSKKFDRHKRARVTGKLLDWEAATRKRAHRTKDAPQVVADAVRRANAHRARKVVKQSLLPKDQIGGVLEALRRLRAATLQPRESRFVFVVLASYHLRAAYSTREGARAYIEGRAGSSQYRIVRVPLDKRFRRK